MMSTVTMRLSGLLAATPPARRAAVETHCGTSDSDLLGAPSAIRQRFEELELEARACLGDMLAFDPGFLELSVPDPVVLDRLLERAFVIEIAEDSGTRFIIPVEVRISLLDDRAALSAPIVALLGAWEPDDLQGLCDLHGLELDAADDTVEAAVELAEILTDVERLDGLFDSLPPATKRLVHWFCEVETPVPSEKASAMASRFAELAGDGGSGERVLLRLGVAHEIYIDGDSLFVVPPDVREAMRPLIEASLTARCRSLYETLREEALPAFRDIFPHGYGGNPLVAARSRMLRGVIAGPDPADLLDRVLTVFRVLDNAEGIGELASTHLDTATPDRFAQECLRSWLGSLDDEFTRVLVAPFGGDSIALADWILSENKPSDSGQMDAEDWSAFLYDLRANLLFVLSVLPPGHWFPLTSLARWFASIYRRLLWHAGGFHGVDDELPQHALPLPGVEVTHEEETRLYDALVTIFAEFLEPIGSVRMDTTAERFMTNPEALRLFRDGDPGFDTLWTDAETVVGDDIELWLPVPSSWGVRASGVAWMRWVGDYVVEVGPDAHVQDLLTLALFGSPLFGVGPQQYMFTEESVARGVEHGGDVEVFALWLQVRTGALAEQVAQLLLGDIQPSDEPLVDSVELVVRLLSAIEEWSPDLPPLALIEEIRSWGDAAIGVLHDRFAALVEGAEWDNPRLPHYAVLLGELGAVVAVPLLLRTLGYGKSEPAEGSAAMALARIGSAAHEGLDALIGNVTATPDKRLLAAGALSSLAVLHPTFCEECVTSLKRPLAEVEELPEDIPSLLGIFIAETGHRHAEALLHEMREQGLWLDTVMPFDEALWIAGLSPAVWGHPVFGAPLSYLFPPLSEAERRRDLASEEPVRSRRRRR